MKPSRAMITGEISWAFIALCFAWGGSGMWPFEASALHARLYDWDYNYLWTAVIGIPALGLMWISGTEYLSCQNSAWDFPRINDSAHKRGRLCFALAFVWAYIFYVLNKATTEPAVMSLIALGGAWFCLWFWAENRRVQREYRRNIIAPA
jgi:hypothetical protein